MSIELLIGKTADGPGGAANYNGGKMAVFAWGTFGGGVLTLEVLAPDGVTWVRADGTTWSDSLCKQIELPPCKVRATLTGAISPNVSCSIINY